MPDAQVLASSVAWSCACASGIALLGAHRVTASCLGVKMVKGVAIGIIVYACSRYGKWAWVIGVVVYACCLHTEWGRAGTFRVLGFMTEHVV